MEIPLKATGSFLIGLLSPLWIEMKFFKYKTVISEGLAKKLQLNSNIYILPLGADIISSTRKTFDEMNLLYVGTLYNRKIEDTLVGFANFYQVYKNKIKMRYTIIGKGKDNEEQKYKLK